jgi:hypothetical protein
MNLLRTITPKGTRYFINSKRVTRDKYDEAKFGRTLSCIQTNINKGTTRQYCIAS